MLQRKADSSADYGTPLVISSKGWFHKFFDHKKITEKIPVITSKVPDQNEFWSKLKYLARIETPMRIAGVVILGTLLGAAYAVTTKNADKQGIEVSVSDVDSEVVAQDLMEVSVIPVNSELNALSSEAISNESEAFIMTAINSFSQTTTTPENNNGNITLALKSLEINQEESKVASAFKLVSTEKGFKIIQPEGFSSSKKVINEETYSSIVIPEELIPDVAEEGGAGLSEEEQQRILALEKKLALARKKLERFDMENLKLQGKFETLIVKNRALSDQLRHIDTVTTELNNR